MNSKYDRARVTRPLNNSKGFFIGVNPKVRKGRYKKNKYICQNQKINTMARLTEYNFEMCQIICAEVADGFNIKTILKSKEEYPDFSTWCRWKRNNDELRNLYVNAMQDKAESEIEEIDYVYDMLKAGEIEPSAANVLIQTNKWKASKFYPKMYGDKVDVTTNGEKINHTPIFGDNPLDNNV